jgi:flagellar motility protein MotE (MotC chaperone)
MNYWLLIAVLFTPVAIAQQAPTPEEVDIDVPVRDYSEAEIQLLQELEVERVKLERRSQALELREKLVDLAEARLGKKIVELKGLQSSLEKLLGNLSQMEEAEIEQLARIYENMKPAAAAEILNKLDNAIVYDVFKRMDNKKTAKIMESLTLPKARLISEMLAERSDLPPLDVPPE